MRQIINRLCLLMLMVQTSFFVFGQQERPNILLIMTDEHQADALGVKGNEYVTTPNLDNLAKEGTMLDNAYVTFPLCTPSRSSFFTGKMPHELGVLSNVSGENKLRNDFRHLVLGNVLKNLGYENAYGGKWHVHEPEMVEGNGFKKIANFGDIGLADKSVDYLKTRVGKQEPFFLVVSFDNPHNIAEWARNQPLPYGEVPQTKANKLPPLPDNFERGEFFPEAVAHEYEANKRVYPTGNYTEEDWRKYRYTYYKLVEKVDREIGKILGSVKSLGLEKNTLIIFTSDHGDGNAAHRWNQKTILYDESIRVPLIFKLPDVIVKGKVVNQLFSNGSNLYNTILDFAGYDMNEGSQNSFRPILEGKNDKRVNDFVVVETKFAGKNAYNTEGRALITDEFKYIVYGWGKNREELFELKTDRGEQKNLAYDERRKEMLNEMRTKLYNWSRKNKDPFLRKVVLPDNSKISTSTLFDKPY